MMLTKKLETETISDYKAFLGLKEEWNNLLGQSENDYVFFTHEWFDCWWQAFGSGQCLFVIVARENGEIAGIAPFMICKGKMKGLPVSRLQFMANDDSPRCDLIVRRGNDGVLKEMINSLLTHSKKYDVLLFENMEDKSLSVRYVQEAALTGNHKCYTDTKLNSPWISLDKDWDAFFDGLSAKSKKTIRNVTNRVQRLGNVEIIEYKNADKLELMDEISKKAWKYAEGKSYLNRPDRKTFMENISRIAEEKGWLSIWLLQIDGKPVAYEYHLCYNSSNISFLAEFDQDYESHSPGAALDFHIIKRLFEKKEIKEYNLAGTLDNYKKKWKPNIRVQNDYYFFGDSCYSKLLYYIETQLIKAVKEIRKKIPRFKELK